MLKTTAMFGLSVHFFGAAHKHMQQCGLAPLQHLLMRRTLPSQRALFVACFCLLANMPKQTLSCMFCALLSH